MRAGSWTQFEKRFEPQPAPSHDFIWEPWEVPKDADWHFWWTLVESDHGHLYAVPGYRFINRFGYIHTRQKWQDETREYLYG
ncbi:MAG: hypothetical protein DI628_00745 [Blastochloris viridis]|uniref:Uncharacterized protein n=1 Tax=Blastochloris viridis TaxID=1079 RepID=A0A6N4R758_BLAVI|nr:MAG: hypothetical protein DI628_00745 [Blastochloris viridis]